MFTNIDKYSILLLVMTLNKKIIEINQYIYI